MALSSRTPCRAQCVQAAVVGPGHAEVGFEFGVDVLQRRRQRHPGPDAEAQPVGLSPPVVRVLAQDHRLDVRVGREVQGGEDLLRRREDLAPGPFPGHEPVQLGEVVGLQLGLQDRVPVGLPH